MEAFSDGVIAVIITIMVLEFKVPQQPGLAPLLALLPTLLIYALSFAYVGIYWVNHHYIVHRLRRVDGLVLWANLGLLFSLSLLPFFTSYLIEQHLQPLSVEFYALSTAVDGIAFQLLSTAVRRNLRRAKGEQKNGDDLRELTAESTKGTISVLLNVAALIVTRSHPRLGLGFLALVPPLWFVPRFLLGSGSSAPDDAAAANN